jgi:hypothetical protein
MEQGWTLAGADNRKSTLLAEAASIIAETIIEGLIQGLLLADSDKDAYASNIEFTLDIQTKHLDLTDKECPTGP